MPEVETPAPAAPVDRQYAAPVLPEADHEVHPACGIGLGRELDLPAAAPAALGALAGH